MDSEVLVDDRLADGFELLRGLIRADFPVTAALWVRPGADSSWQFWIAVVPPRSSGEAGLYARLYAQIPKSSSIQAPHLSLVNSSDPAAALAIQLRDRRPQQNRPIHAGPSLLRPVGLYEAIIYPKVGKMSADEVGLALAHEMNRAGESLPVTLTLADGHEVRGYPLAIRKSPLGGAMVELADADTKGKGADVPLDRIFSVVPDSLTP